MVPDVTVLVVGAGPTGLLLGAELKRRGVDSLIIDAHDAPLAWDRATVVHPRSIEVFDHLGLADALLDAGVKQRVARIHADGAVLGRDRSRPRRQPLRLQSRHLRGGDGADPHRLPRPPRRRGDARHQARGPGGARRWRRRHAGERRRNQGDPRPLGGGLRRPPQRRAHPRRHRAGWPPHRGAVGGVRRHSHRLPPRLRGELRLSGRDPAHPHRLAGRALARLCAAERAGQRSRGGRVGNPRALSAGFAHRGCRQSRPLPVLHAGGAALPVRPPAAGGRCRPHLQPHPGAWA